MDNKLKKIYKEISLKYCLPANVIDEILRSELEVVIKSMNESTLEDIDSFKVTLLPYLGKFAAKPKKLDKLVGLYKEGKFNSVIINGKREKL